MVFFTIDSKTGKKLKLPIKISSRRLSLHVSEKILTDL